MANAFDGINDGDTVEVVFRGRFKDDHNVIFLYDDDGSDYCIVRDDPCIKSVEVVERAFVEPQYKDEYEFNGCVWMFLKNDPEGYGPYWFWNSSIGRTRYFNKDVVKKFKKIS